MRMIIALALLAWARPALAARTQNPSTGLFVNFFGGGVSNDAANIALQITMIILALSGIVSMAYLILGGTQYMMSGVNEDMAKSGKRRIQNSIIGLIIILLSYTIISVVFRTFSPAPTP